MLRIAQTLHSQLLAAMERAFPEAAAAAEASGKPLDPALGPASKPEFGDFQANGALALVLITLMSAAALALSPFAK